MNKIIGEIIIIKDKKMYKSVNTERVIIIIAEIVK